MHTHIRIYTHIYTHMHTYTHIHIYTQQMVRTIAGDPKSFGTVDGPAVGEGKAKLNSPAGLALSSNGAIVFTETGGHCIRQLDRKFHEVGRRM